MTDLLGDAGGNIVLIRRSNLLPNQINPPLATKYTYNPMPVGSNLSNFVPVEKPPLPATVKQPHLNSKENHSATAYSSNGRPETEDTLFFAHFVPVWCCTCILLVIGFFFCPILSFIGCVFACAAKRTEVSLEKSDPRLKRAEDCNRIACHLGVSSIIAGFILLAATVAVLLFLFLSSAKILLDGSV